MSHVIGVDLGGTKVAVASLRDRELGESVVEPTQSAGPEPLIDQLVAMIESSRDDELEGVGVGVPSVVDFETGRVLSSVNVPLADVALREVLGNRLGVPVFVDNDANVAALAEAHDENLIMVARDLVMITVGTGVGGGLILGGRIYRGATGGAGEVGHMLIGADLTDATPKPEDFPQAGSLEGLAAGHALDALAVKCATANPDSALGKLLADGHKPTGVDAVQAARAGDEVAANIVRRWGERLGIGIANVMNMFDPEEVVIGGGAARAGDLLLEPARQTAAGFVVPGLGARTTIRLARHGVRAGVLGAALLAVHELAGDPTPAPTHELGDTPTPAPTWALGETPTPAPAKELGGTPTPAPTKELGETPTPSEVA